MQPPISIGTILQNRYRLTKLLGHGSMVRTYLAEDQGRFNELCTLQEIIPAPVAESIEKSKEIFLRETAVLYQIQHPQIPQVRATFERDRRLYLVQDYVEGKTLSKVLSERRVTAKSFTEADVLLLLEQLLPVLAYLHSQGIIHQGISPNNIILRDRTPVLGSFGIIKYLAARLQSPSKYQLVPVGIGYAPIEQILHTGIYPSSDLYALAVTALVLLTGLELPELFDDNTQSWYWQQQIIFSPQTNEMLRRMLSYRPSDRYQSVAEVEQVLQYINSIPQTISSDLPWGKPELPQPIVEHSNTKANQSEPMPITKRKVWDKPWAVILIYTLVAIATGVSSGVVVSALLAKQRLTERKAIAPQNFPSPLVLESSTPVPTTSETPTPNPDRNSQRLTLKPGQRATFRGSIKAKAISYTFHGEQGQQLSASLTNDNVLLSVLGLDQAPIDDTAKRVMRYQGVLPSTGDYTIKLSPVLETSTKYRLILRLGAVQLTPRANDPNSTLSPSMTPEINQSPKLSR